jgi:hypothetical protein
MTSKTLPTAYPEPPAAMLAPLRGMEVVWMVRALDGVVRLGVNLGTTQKTLFGSTPSSCSLKLSRSKSWFSQLRSINTGDGWSGLAFSLIIPERVFRVLGVAGQAVFHESDKFRLVTVTALSSPVKLITLTLLISLVFAAVIVIVRVIGDAVGLTALTVGAGLTKPAAVEP